MAPLARSATALLLLLALASGSPGAGERVVYVGSDGDWESFLEAVPEAMRYDDFDRPVFSPILAVPDLSPYPVEIRTHVRQGKLVFRAEGRLVDGIPEPRELVAELRQKIVLPSLTESVVLTKDEGLELVSAVLVRIGKGEEIPVAPGLRLDRPEGGEWQVVLRMKEGAAGSGTVRLDFEVRGHDLAVVEKFLDDWRADRIVLCGKLPPAVRERLASKRPMTDGSPARKLEPERPVVVSIDYDAALVGAHVAALDDTAHLVFRSSVEETARRVRERGGRRVKVIHGGTDVRKEEWA
ncbi:MAG: hypothetical protein MUE73_21075, partial [Planctomycetes bacterium]|nr:hypothetical protein [Planctomycetota bacterium]